MTVGRSTSPTHKKGAAAEMLAAKFLLAKGFYIIAQNFNSRYGEIDLIISNLPALKATHTYDSYVGAIQPLIIFLEVKYSTRVDYGLAIERVNHKKQLNIIKTAHLFIQENPKYELYDCRFDVISVTQLKSMIKPHIEWIEGAYDLSDYS